MPTLGERGRQNFSSRGAFKGPSVKHFSSITWYEMYAAGEEYHHHFLSITPCHGEGFQIMPRFTYNWGFAKHEERYIVIDKRQELFMQKPAGDNCGPEIGH